MYNTIYPGYVQSYYNINQNSIKKKEDEEKKSQSSNKAEKESQNTTSQRQQTPLSNSYFPNGEKVAIDYTKKQIELSQVLSDFRNTTNAIGTPENIKSEVATYLSLVENQAQKETPNSEIIKSNLKNASKILDEYITLTLKKPSKVVEDWVDALFMQSIDYKIEKNIDEFSNKQNENPIIEEESINLQNNETSIKEEIEKSDEIVNNEIENKKENEKDNENQNQNAIYIPQDERLKRMFIQAKKYVQIDNKEKALYHFQNAMNYAEEIGDEKTQAMIHYEEGKLYSQFNKMEEALYNYAISALQTEDNNLKARAYLSMGKIYDDYVNFEPAVEHYCAAAAYAGEADNIKIQSKAFSDLAQIHSNRYDKNNSDLFMKLAAISANSTNNDKVIGVIYAKNAKMQNKLGEKARALTSYSTSTEAFSNINEYENLAKNYREAAIIMNDYGNKLKAKTLLKKAQTISMNTDNVELQMLIAQDLNDI